MFDSTDYNTTSNSNVSNNAVLYSSTTAKQTSRAVRVWLENKSKLEHAGFHAGARYSIAYREGYAVLTLDQNGPCTVSSCQRNGVVRPIIDLHSKAVAACFEAGSTLEVVYSANVISIHAAY